MINNSTLTFFTKGQPHIRMVQFKIILQVLQKQLDDQDIDFMNSLIPLIHKCC